MIIKYRISKLISKSDEKNDIEGVDGSEKTYYSRPISKQ
jgi:hypothetical protein